MVDSLSQCLNMAILTSAAARVADNFLPDGQVLANEQKAGIITGLLVITLLSNACGIEVESPGSFPLTTLTSLSCMDDLSVWSSGSSIPSYWAHVF